MQVKQYKTALKVSFYLFQHVLSIKCNPRNGLERFSPQFPLQYTPGKMATVPIYKVLELNPYQHGRGRTTY